MSKIYLIPGLGADTRIYNNIDLPADNDVIPINWIDPDKTDTLSSYAQKLIYQYHISNNSILIGNSLGGMIAVEMTKLIPVNKVILISSIKTSSESPWYFGLFRAIPVNRLIPGKLVTSLGFLIKPALGHISDADAWLFNDMLKKTSPKFIKWAMQAVLHWDNENIPTGLYHITGNKDRVFPYKNIKNAQIVKGGTHIMIYDMAKEINKLLKVILRKK
jgi:pimeloyl-ACP methyl ester carboxylesterase